MSDGQYTFLNTKILMSTAEKRKLTRERQKKEMPWLWDKKKRVAQPVEEIEQMGFERLKLTMPVSVVHRARCPKCASSGRLWRIFPKGSDKPVFQVRCHGYPKCDFVLPEEPVGTGTDAVRVWRLALALQGQ